MNSLDVYWVLAQSYLAIQAGVLKSITEHERAEMELFAKV